MVEANPNGGLSCTVKHFAIDETHSYVQYSTTMAEEAFKAITEGDQVKDANTGKNKILIQCLDTSGSMSGAPIEALKLGSNIIGDKYYNAEVRPFEKFITMTYNSYVDSFECGDFHSYKQMINEIRAGGGTNFMFVFEKIMTVLEENPNTEELVVIFITDGQDGYRGKERGSNVVQEYNELAA